MNSVLKEQLALLPEYLGRHLILTIAALSVGIAVSIPLGVLVTRVKPLRGPVMAVVSVIQTIPGLALLALMVPLLGRIGFAPAFVALTLYSMLPMLRNTVAGIEGVDPRVVEAATGLGMTSAQVMFRVRLPLAMPIIIAGIRTATVWTVGVATLSTPVGATSLGNYIFGGLQTQNFTAVVIGCVVAAVLALVLDNIIWLMEVAAKKRSRGLLVTAVASLSLVLGGGLYPVIGQERPDFIVGGKAFTEQYIVAELMATKLREAGFKIEVRTGMGSAVVFDATTRNLVDCYLEYSGTVWSNLMKRKGNPGKEAVLREAVPWLEKEHGLKTLGAFGFENIYALAMRRDRAKALGIKSVEDLIPVASTLSLASDLEFFSRPEWIQLRDTYAFDFKEKLSFDPALMYIAVNEGQVDVITAYSTDGRIEAYDLVVLDDPRNGLLPYDGLLVASPEAAANPEFISALQPLLNAITEEAMRHANKMVDVDGRSIHAAVAYLLKEIQGT